MIEQPYIHTYIYEDLPPELARDRFRRAQSQAYHGLVREALRRGRLVLQGMNPSSDSFM